MQGRRAPVAPRALPVQHSHPEATQAPCGIRSISPTSPRFKETAKWGSTCSGQGTRQGGLGSAAPTSLPDTWPPLGPPWVSLELELASTLAASWVQGVPEVVPIFKHLPSEHFSHLFSVVKYPIHLMRLLVK